MGSCVTPEMLLPSLMTQPWPTTGPSWSWLTVALLDLGEASGNFSLKSLL